MREVPPPDDGDPQARLPLGTEAELPGPVEAAVEAAAIAPEVAASPVPAELEAELEAEAATGESGPVLPQQAAPPVAMRNSALAPLEVPVFRMLWLAWLAANVTMWMNDVAAGWLMTTLSTSTTMVALVQAASTLPVFLLGLPSGALADLLDRRRYFAATQLWVGLNAAVLAVVALADGMNAGLLLLLTFTNGIGLALRWPVFAAIVPEVVPPHHLAGALALNGVAMNLSRIIGPIVAGVLLASFGSAWVFVTNTLLSLVAFGIILRWQSQQKRQSALPGERFVGAMRVGAQHVWQSPRLRGVLTRIFLFFLHSAALLSMLPLIARLLGGGAHLFTALLACQGAGAITAVMLFPRWRARFDASRFITWGPAAHAGATLLVVVAPHPAVAMLAMFVAGMAWISTANTLTVAAQMALPDWVRARGMAIYQMALMGGTAAGSALWGQVAEHVGVRWSLTASALFGLAVLAVVRKRELPSAAEDHSRAKPSSAPNPAIEIDADEGPVMVTVEYLIDPARAAEFARVMQDTKRARLRQGALSWGLFRDSERVGRYVEYFVDESWLEHLRRQERFTAADAGLRTQRLAFHLGSRDPEVRRYVAEQATL
ncbi:MFS transporter [Ideonella sp.]|uniref:MFS transporter n=1 Tax=Ideonella sp. TaxID=1929293 RepID=UPI00351BB434